ncbi:MAG: YopX family protein [Acidiferrobacterales bacterium]|nr:YopX family protein [Acidiferrobacterales bacterium]
MKEIKFRQLLKPQFQREGKRFHYWGYIGDSFVGPMGKNYAAADSEQFIGIKDCDGVEIYEGDTVSDHVDIGSVKYSKKHGGFRVVYRDGGAKWFYDYNLRGERESIKLIGDIHKNPELLGEQK